MFWFFGHNTCGILAPWPGIELQLLHWKVNLNHWTAMEVINFLMPPHAKSWFIGKDSDAGRDWGQEEKGTTEDEMAGWHHRLDGCEFEWTPGVGDCLACCDSRGRKELDMTERLNWTEVNWM